MLTRASIGTLVSLALLLAACAAQPGASEAPASAPASGSGESTAQRLRDAGFSAEYQELEGINHSEIIEPDANPIIVDLIFGAT